MPKAIGYGQFCPVAMSAELLGGRWTLLIVRELLDGPAGFNEIRRGLPLISRTLLSSRLKYMEAIGLLERGPDVVGRNGGYRLTSAGQSLGTVIDSLGEWGQAWIEPDIRLEDIHPGYLMWNVRRSARRIDGMPERFVAKLTFADAPNGRQQHWVIIKREEIDVCYVDPGYDVDVWIDTNLKTFAELWMGWKPLSSAFEDGEIMVDGPREFAENPFRWLGQSRLAVVARRAPSERVRRF